MTVTFEKTYLKELYENGKCLDKKHRFQPHIVKNYRKRIEQLQSAPTPDTLRQFSSLNFEALKGDKAGLFSIRVNDKYRIEFSLSTESEHTLLTICSIVELSNHYD
ncbi:MAG: type II toxin-antitoxin system RelE/ParE family toxin [Muribaculaceae bacterium]|nr:type II toxin-antitoxin system RelE/ParE family toxin [Muribaculaceae bacterium]